MAKQKFIIDLKAVLELGEGQFIEFKESPDKSLPKEMVAFANASGGVIYLGITDFMEKAGTGIKRVTNACVENSNKVNFEFSDSFWVTIETNNKDSVVDNVVDNEKEILNLLKSNPKLSATELAKKTNLSSRSIQRYLKLLREKKYIKRVGPAKGGHWEIINE